MNLEEGNIGCGCLSEELTFESRSHGKEMSVIQELKKDLCQQVQRTWARILLWRRTAERRCRPIRWGLQTKVKSGDFMLGAR
jgi:hypothetical protein